MTRYAAFAVPLQVRASMNAISHPIAESEMPDPFEASLAQLLADKVPESDLAFFHRRALEEAIAARRARAPQAAAAHRYLSAAYAEQARRSAQAEAQFQALLETLG
jgi:hypothetical protein